MESGLGLAIEMSFIKFIQKPSPPNPGRCETCLKGNVGTLAAVTAMWINGDAGNFTVVKRNYTEVVILVFRIKPAILIVLLHICVMAFCCCIEDDIYCKTYFHFCSQKD